MGSAVCLALSDTRRRLVPVVTTSSCSFWRRGDRSASARHASRRMRGIRQVLAIDEAGRFVIPLLGRTPAGDPRAGRIVGRQSRGDGGHHHRFLRDRWPPSRTCSMRTRRRLETRTYSSRLAARLLNGEPIAIVSGDRPARRWLDQRALPSTSRRRRPARDGDRSSDHRPPFHDRTETLWFRPRSLVFGVGCETRHRCRGSR